MGAILDQYRSNAVATPAPLPSPTAVETGFLHNRTWLKLWPACSRVWIGDIYSSGKPEHWSLDVLEDQT